MGEVSAALFWTKIEELLEMISDLKERVEELENPEKKCNCRECA